MQWFPAWMAGSQKLSADKVLATVFRDNKGALSVVFLQKGRIISGEYDAKSLEKLIRIRRKRKNLEEEWVFFFPR
jgi:hypothetical protein